MRRSIALLALAAVLAACGDDPDIATLGDMRVVVRGGDGQRVQVPPSDLSASAVPAAVVGADGYAPEPLVAEVVDEGGSASVVGPAGVSYAVVPAGTDVHWHVSAGGGTVFGSTTETDDSAYVINRWAPGIVAGPVTVTAGRLIGDSITTDATWNLEVLAGPAVVISIPDTLRLLEGMPWTAEVAAVQDEYGNAVPFAFAATGAATADGRTLTPGAWGTGSYDVLREDSVIAGGEVLTHPNLHARSVDWLAELVCETPDTTYMDRMRMTLTPYGGQSDDVDDWPPAASERAFFADGDTLLVFADSTYPVYPPLLTVEHASGRIGTAPSHIVTYDYRWLDWRQGPNGDWPPIDDLSSSPPANNALSYATLFPLPLAHLDSLVWRTTDVVTACHEDGFTSATAGSYTVRPAGT